MFSFLLALWSVRLTVRNLIARWNLERLESNGCFYLGRLMNLRVPVIISVVVNFIFSRFKVTKPNAVTLWSRLLKWNHRYWCTHNSQVHYFGLQIILHIGFIVFFSYSKNDSNVFLPYEKSFWYQCLIFRANSFSLIKLTIISNRFGCVQRYKFLWNRVIQRNFWPRYGLDQYFMFYNSILVLFLINEPFNSLQEIRLFLFLLHLKWL